MPNCTTRNLPHDEKIPAPRHHLRVANELRKLIKAGVKFDREEVIRDFKPLLGWLDQFRDGAPMLERRSSMNMRELGRRGGLRGGKARAAALSAEQRKQIAQSAAAARWKKAA